MNFSIVNAQISDIPVIFSQAKSLIDAYEDVASIDYERVLRWMERKITQNICEYRCLITDGQRCAFWHLCEDGELDDLYVLPAFRNMGIGSLILKQCIEESKEPVWLYVFSRNKRAISFYERFGFTVRESVGATRLIMERMVDTVSSKVYNSLR